MLEWGAIMTGHRKPNRSGPKVLIAVWIIAFQSLQTLGARADFRIERTLLSLNLFISGTITQRDADALQELSAELERSSPRVNLDSKGGDVLAAMQIGRLIRKYDGTTWIGFKGEKCYSSCTLIFIAGVRRHSMGELGLHRPYLASVPESRQAVEKKVPLMLSLVKNYVAEMGITDNFYQRMVNTEPSQMVIYKGDDFKKLVPADDPVYQEVEISYDARFYGVTTSEMRRRERDAEDCRSGESWYDCVEAARWGLSEGVYRERYKKVRECLLDEDRKRLNAIPTKERRDHPLYIKFETCARNAMLRP
jgi:hypothetical protein